MTEDIVYIEVWTDMPNLEKLSPRPTPVLSLVLYPALTQRQKLSYLSLHDGWIGTRIYAGAHRSNKKEPG